MKLLFTGVLIALGLISGHAIAQEGSDNGNALILEVGPAFDRDVKSKTTNYGAALAVEATLIEKWLEVEVGAARLSGSGRSEVGFDVLFKKPFRLSETTELMVGVGPEVTRTTSNGTRTTSHAVEFALDFMFWPDKDIGWFVEPGYSVGLGNSKGERSFGATAGLILKW